MRLDLAIHTKSTRVWWNDKWFQCLGRLSGVFVILEHIRARVFVFFVLRLCFVYNWNFVLAFFIKLFLAVSLPLFLSVRLFLAQATFLNTQILLTFSLSIPIRLSFSLRYSLSTYVFNKHHQKDLLNLLHQPFFSLARQPTKFGHSYWVLFSFIIRIGGSDQSWNQRQKWVYDLLLCKGLSSFLV